MRLQHDAPQILERPTSNRERRVLGRRLAGDGDAVNVNAFPAEPIIDIGEQLVTIDVMLRIAMWDAVFTGGDPVRWKSIIDGLIARGAKL